MNYYGEMDKECVELCDAINSIDGLMTIESCCGHGKEPFIIWFIVKKIKNLPKLLYYCDFCHVGFNWDCLVTTDCAMNPVHFRIESRSKGEMAYEEASIIAQAIREYLAEKVI